MVAVVCTQRRRQRHTFFFQLMHHARKTCIFFALSLSSCCCLSNKSDHYKSLHRIFVHLTVEAGSTRHTQYTSSCAMSFIFIYCMCQTIYTWWFCALWQMNICILDFRGGRGAILLGGGWGGGWSHQYRQPSNINRSDNNNSKNMLYKMCQYYLLIPNLWLSLWKSGENGPISFGSGCVYHRTCAINTRCFAHFYGEYLCFWVKKLQITWCITLNKNRTIFMGMTVFFPDWQVKCGRVFCLFVVSHM